MAPITVADLTGMLLFRLQVPLGAPTPPRLPEGQPPHRASTAIIVSRS
jgi:hypothetical protein